MVTQERIDARARAAARMAAELFPKVVMPTPIVSKSRTHRGQKYGGQQTGMYALISKEDGKTSIKLSGVYGNYCNVDITFKEGDTAVYDSFNFEYLGEIIKITDKCVTIKPQYGQATKRLDIETFANRNYKFDLERSTKQRNEWSD